MNRLDESVEFAQNPDPRCPCVLQLDTSRSMSGERIAALNEGLRAFQADLQQDPLAQRRVEVAIITFGGEVQLTQDFVTAGQFVAPTLTAGGNTPMGAAINCGASNSRRCSSGYRRVRSASQPPRSANRPHSPRPAGQRSNS